MFYILKSKTYKTYVVLYQIFYHMIHNYGIFSNLIRTFFTVLDG